MPSSPPPPDPPAFSSPPPPPPPPSLPPRQCEGCATSHPGTYGSGRFCSATCAKKVGAKHKWAARAAPGVSRRPGPVRRALPHIPCEACAKLHDRSYGSGRFCSVHCARRVAATRKWQKSRADKSKRLDAIRPAMLAPPPPAPSHTASPASVAGKRRRVVARAIQTLPQDHHHPPPSYYVTGATYAVVSPQEPSPGHAPRTASPAAAAAAAAGPAAAYLPPTSMPSLRYDTPTPLPTHLPGPQFYPPVSSPPAHPTPLFYPPPYPVLHPPHLPDHAPYSLLPAAPQYAASPAALHGPRTPYASPYSLLPRNPAFEMETVSPSPSSPPSSSDFWHSLQPHAPAPPHANHLHPFAPLPALDPAAPAARHILRAHHAAARDLPANADGSEAARALLSLRATNS